MSRKIQTLDLEFDEWCHELLQNGMDQIDFLRVACRCWCADLCRQHGLIGTARAITRNEDGEIIDG